MIPNAAGFSPMRDSQWSYTTFAARLYVTRRAFLLASSLHDNQRTQSLSPSRPNAVVQSRTGPVRDAESLAVVMPFISETYLLLSHRGTYRLTFNLEIAENNKDIR
jgi:hypothetical protein